jgi:crossover junction endodeoxyribonuclease RuvC
VDPGLASTGVGVIERHDRGWRYVASEDVRTTTSQPMPERLARIHDLVERFIRLHEPEALAIESLFFAKNVRSAVVMAHGRGVAILAAARLSLPVHEYSPPEIKQSVVGHGRATKEQVMAMVKLLLGMREVPGSDHQADALAAALAHAYRSEAAGAGVTATEREEPSEAKRLLAQAFNRRRRR